MDQKDNTGVLFKNDKGGVETRPDYTGTVTVNGQSLRIAAWIKDGRKGKFMSLSFSEDRQKERRQEPEQRGGIGPDLDDSVPFAPVRMLP